MNMYMPSEQHNLEQLVFVRSLDKGGAASSRAIDLYMTPDGDYRVIKWFRPDFEQWRGPDVEESILSQLGSIPGLNDYIVKYYGRFDDPRQGIGLVLEAFVPETGYLSFGRATSGDQSILESLASTEELAKATNLMHRAGYANSDFKGEIFVTRDGKRLKLIDFNQATYQDPQCMLSALDRTASFVRATFEILADRVETGNHLSDGVNLDATSIRDIIRNNLPRVDTERFPSRDPPLRGIPAATEEWHKGVMYTSQKIRGYIAGAKRIPEYLIQIGYLQGTDDIGRDIAGRLEREFGGQILEIDFENVQYPYNRIVGNFLLQTDREVTADAVRMLGDPAYAMLEKRVKSKPNRFDHDLIAYGDVFQVKRVN